MILVLNAMHNFHMLQINHLDLIILFSIGRTKTNQKTLLETLPFLMWCHSQKGLVGSKTARFEGSSVSVGQTFSKK